MMETKKKNISLRLSQSDLGKVKQIAVRLGVRETDILRFGIKQMLVKLAPFQEESYRGVDLVPALLEVGEEMVRFFELDTEQLEHIINSDAELDEKSVTEEDIKLLALSSVNDGYARLKLQLDSKEDAPGEQSFKEYFLKKYFTTTEPEHAVKKQREWMPFLAKDGHGTHIPKRA